MKLLFSVILDFSCKEDKIQKNTSNYVKNDYEEILREVDTVRRLGEDWGRSGRETVNDLVDLVIERDFY